MALASRRRPSLAPLRPSHSIPPSPLAPEPGAERLPLWRPHVKYAACLALALTLCAVGLSRAEDKALPGNYEHLKKLEPLIGTWTGEFVAPHDHPTANIKKGDKLTLTLTYKWDLNKSAI